MDTSQFKFDQAGIMKAAPIPVIVGAIGGALWISVGLWGIAGIIGWVAPIFGGVWYVMTLRKTGEMPDQMNSLANGAILGGIVALAYGILALLTSPMGANTLAGEFLGGLGISFNVGFSITDVITGVLFGAIGGAIGAFGYKYMVDSGNIS